MRTILFKDFIKLQRGYDLPKSKFVIGDIPVLGSTSILGYHNEAKVKGPGVVTGRSGTLGVIQYVDTDYWPHNTALWVKDFYGNEPRFVYYFLKCIDLSKYNSGGAVPTLNRNVLDNIEIRIPNVEKQKKIVDIILKYDNLIENNFKRIKLLEETADLIYKEWFINLRFPGYEKCEFVDGIPNNWIKGVVNDAIEFNIGGGWGQEEKSGDFTESAYVIRGTDIPNLTKGEFNNVPYRYHKESNLLNRKLLTGDIIFEASGGSKGQSIGRTLYINNAVLSVFNHNVMCASFCKLIRAKNIELSYYLLSFIKNARMNGTLALYESQSASNIINFRFTDFLNKQELIMPDKKVLFQFRNVIEPITNQLALLCSQIDKLKEARDILIQKLITGEIEV